MTEEEKAKLPEAFRKNMGRIGDLPTEVAREMSAKGNEVLAEQREERKSIADICREIDDMPLDAETIKEIAKKLGAPEEWVAKMTHRHAKAFSVNRRILTKGDVREWVEWLKVTGEYTETVNVNNSGDAPLADGIVRFTSRKKE